MNIEAELILYYSNPIMSDFCSTFLESKNPRNT